MNKTMKLPLSECSINQIYLDSAEKRKYMIPIYQRNYAWEEEEIVALVKDVYDSFCKDKDSIYYIGTLVTYRRSDELYEVIDGQQRLTTLYILLKVLGIKDICNPLTYSARSVSAATLAFLDNFPELGVEVDPGIRDGYKYAAKGVASIVDELSRNAFVAYLLHNVHLIHYNVPKDVDLNHYFEVMNSRGEQLEKHEIVKSVLGEKLGDKNLLATFSRIWEACSEMNVYIQQAFADENVFGKSLDAFLIECFDQIPIRLATEGKRSILELMESPIARSDNDAQLEDIDKFQPIIDFPNFLLIVLKLTMIRGMQDFDPSQFALDDKELLREFSDNMQKIVNNDEFPKEFAFNLLKCRYLLDNYVVHHSLTDSEKEGDNPWKLQRIYKENARKIYPKNISSDQDVQKEIVHLLSMFEVSFTPKQRKNYLLYTLLYLFDKKEIAAKDYLQFLRDIAAKYFFDVYLDESCLNERHQPKPNAFDSVMLYNGNLSMQKSWRSDGDLAQLFKSIYNQGNADIPLFVFNYTDYRLWKMYAESIRGERLKKGAPQRVEFFSSLGCSDFELDTFNNFYFSRTRKSLEHYYPKAKTVREEHASESALTLEQINCFGNFAMIGAEANSSGSAWDPLAKLEHYTDGRSNPVSVASLKFKIMMQICYDNHAKMLSGELKRPRGMEWNYADMQLHQQRIINILKQL